MSTLVRVIDNLGSGMTAAGDVDVHLGHAPGRELDQIAVTFMTPASPGNVELSWSVYHLKPMSRFPGNRYLATGLVDVVYDEPRQLLQGAVPFTVGESQLVVLRLTRLRGVAASLERTIITATFNDGPAMSSEGE